MYWNDGPRTWKWAVPAIFAAGLLLGAWELPEGSLKVATPLAVFGLIFLVMALTNWWKLISAHRVEMFSERQVALSKTPLVLLAENMKQMHPEAVRVLNRFGVRTSWQVRVSKNFGERDWVLADTNVHFGFIEFVLSRSNGALYPMRNLSQGSKKWDPDGIVEDREQYDELEKWLFARMMVTRSHGDFKPAEFIPPWTPALILETMGLTGEQDLYRPEEEQRKDLGAESAKDHPASGAGVSGVRSNGQKAVDSGQSAVVSNQKDEEITDEQMEAIEVEMARYQNSNA